MTGYDIIGDVHGYADRLKNLLSILGYEETAKGWVAPAGRQAVFVGDLIDRGEQQLETLRIVRAMQKEGVAHVVMGNHEYNAIAYATIDPETLDYCRPHSKKNTHQHEAFIGEVEFDSPLHRKIIDWFMDMPLWLELDGIRVIHACWSEDDMNTLNDHLAADDRALGTRPVRKLTREGVVATSRKGTPAYKALEVLLKGPEIGMGGYYYFDKDGHRRDEARLRWWDPEATTLAELAIVPSGCDLRNRKGEETESLPGNPVGATVPRYEDEIPVFVGHYWESGRHKTFGDRVACVDYSAGKGGPLVAYRWDEGDTVLDDAKFVDS